MQLNTTWSRPAAIPLFYIPAEGDTTSGHVLSSIIRCRAYQQECMVTMQP